MHTFSLLHAVSILQSCAAEFLFRRWARDFKLFKNTVEWWNGMHFRLFQQLDPRISCVLMLYFKLQKSLNISLLNRNKLPTNSQITNTVVSQEYDSISFYQFHLTYFRYSISTMKLSFFRQSKYQFCIENIISDQTKSSIQKTNSFTRW